MAIVLVYTVYSILIVLYESTSHDIDRHLRLNTAVAFMYDQHRCHFDKEYAQKKLEDKNTTCQAKCKVEIKGVNMKMNTLWNVEIKLDGAKYHYDPCPDNKDNHKMLTMLIDCPNWNKEKVPVGGCCMQDEQCQEIKYSGVCKQGRCVCSAGYILINLECYEGNLALNQSCSFGEQCAGSPYASCLGGYCSCIEGYTATNSTDCVQSQEITFSSSSQHHQEGNIGTILGALFGGLLLGVILTIAAMVIIHSRSHTHVKKREELNVTFTDNDSSAKVVDHSDFQNIKAKDKKPEVSPYSCLEETSVYDHAPKKTIIGQTQDDVYNHLHEEVKQSDVNYYDHACAASAHSGDMSDYSHLRHATS